VPRGRTPSDTRVLSSRGASERAAVIVLIAAVLRLAAARQFHSDSGGKNAGSQQRNEPAPADPAARLNRTCTELRSEPNRRFARGKRQLGPFNSSAPRLQSANDCDDRDQQERSGEYRRRDQWPVALGEPNECKEQNESRGQKPAYESNQPPPEQAGAQ